MKIRKTILGWASAIVCVLAVTTACNESLYIEEEIHRPPQITEFSPKTGMAGTKVYIQGTDFKEVKDITIGGRKVNVTRVNSKLVMAEVTAKAVTGAIEVITPYGVARSEETFAVEYRRPVVTDSPAAADLFGTVQLKGTNLDLVERVYFGTAEATILEQKDNLLTVSVPYYRTDDEVKIRCTYMYGLNSEDAFAPIPFKAIKVEPDNMVCAASAGVGARFAIAGEHMTIVEKVTVNGYKATIESQTEEKVICTLPAELTEFSENNTVVVSYWGGAVEQTVSTEFAIRELPYNFWPGTVLYANQHDDPRRFFSGATGKYYTACEFEESEDVRAEAHLSIQAQGKGMTIRSLNEGAAIFTCNEKGLAQKGLWMRFRKLDPANAADAKYIRMINEGSLENVSVEQAKADGLNYVCEKATIRHKKSDTAYNTADSKGEGTDIGDISMVTVYRGTTAVAEDAMQIGFIKLRQVDVTKDDDAKGTITVDFYFQKDY